MPLLDAVVSRDLYFYSGTCKSDLCFSNAVEFFLYVLMFFL
jgi:hypothetical protein